MMNRFLALGVLMALAGCTSFSAVANSRVPNKVYVTKTTWYLVWSTNEMEECDINGSAIDNCQTLAYR
jgi:hypothetical protein